MQTQIGLWIDHSRAVVVSLNADAEQIQHIESGIEHRVRSSGRDGAAEGSTDDQRDRQFMSHLNTWFDKIIATLPSAASLFLFGPGEAKTELQKRLIFKALGGQIVGVETTDKMTDPQIAAKVRDHYRQ